MTFTEAAALGIDSLQHGFITNTEYIAGKQPDICPPGNQKLQADVDVNNPEVQASIRTIVQHRTAVASTLSTYESFIPDQPIDRRGLDFFAPDTRAEVEKIHAGLPEASFNVSRRVAELVADLAAENLIESNRAVCGATPVARSSSKAAYRKPELSKFSDMAEMFAMDPPLPGLAQ